MAVKSMYTVANQVYRGRLTTWLPWSGVQLLRSGLRRSPLEQEGFRESGTATQWTAALAGAKCRLSYDEQLSYRSKPDYKTCHDGLAQLAEVLEPLIEEARRQEEEHPPGDPP